MRKRRLGLQGKWGHVVDSLESIVPSYELASSRISLFSDREMREEAADFVAGAGKRVLDLGAGPGTMARTASNAGSEPVLLDVSRAMLAASGFPLKVQAAFEALPFRPGVFDGVVSGFAVRDSHDLALALAEVKRVTRSGGRFGFCDLGRPDSPAFDLFTAFYLRTMPTMIGLATAGTSGLGYGSLFDTYVLTPHNSRLKDVLGCYFEEVAIHERQMGAAIVAKCRRGP